MAEITLIVVYSSWQLVPIYQQEVVDSVDSVPFTAESCKMMFPVSYLVYSINYFTCVFANNKKDQSKWRI